MSLYRNIDEFLKPPEEKAFLFFSWHHVFLILGGFLAGLLLGEVFALSASGKATIAFVCVVIGGALGTFRLETIPLYQVIVSLFRYFIQRVSNRQAMVVHAAVLWPGSSGPLDTGIYIAGSEGLVFQVGEETTEEEPGG